MRNLLQLNEVIENYRNNAISFIDIDETTFHTYAKIKVLKDGKLVRELDNQEFNTYTLKDGEYFNFDEFSDSNVFNKTSTPIEPMVKKIKKLIDCIKLHEKKEKVIFLTARGDFNDKDLFLQTFRDNGIDVDISNVYIERTEDIKHKLKMTVAEVKRYIILKYLQSGEYTLVRMFDDDEKNLQTFIELGREINQGKYGVLEATKKKYNNINKLIFYPLLVLADGRVRKYSLLENRRNFRHIINEGIEEIKRYYPLIPQEAWAKIVKLDPTYKGGNELGKYTKWILNLYNNYLKDIVARKKWLK